MRFPAFAAAALVIASATGCGKLLPRGDAEASASAGASAAPAGSAAPVVSAAASSSASTAAVAVEAPATPPPGYVVVKVLGVTPSPSGGAAVFLLHEADETVVPIFVGGTEAL